MSDSRARNGQLRIVGLAGSLRRASFNRLLLCATQHLAPPSLTIEIESLADLPLFNEDEEIAGPPDSVVRLRRSVKAAHGLLLVTPEYNHGVPGVMKNAIDWLSQPLRGSVLDNKPTGIMGASTGLAGTARGQAQLRQAFVLTNTPTMLRPEVLVGKAHEKFNASGRLTDEATILFISDFLIKFESWVTRQLRVLEDEPRV